MINMRKKGCRCIILIILSVLFILVFSSSTSPLYPIPWGGDSAVFLTIGKYWTKGVIPYTELWDQKGPLIYFIDALGYLFTGERYGICIVEAILLFISLLFAYKTFLLYNVPDKKSMLFTLLFLLSLPLSFMDNGAEEYTFPLIMISLYCYAKWIKTIKNDGAYKHSLKSAFIYGMTFSVAFLTRLTNALGICAGVAVITVTLLVNHEWKNLLQNMLAFISGVLVLIFPFWIYFHLNHATYDWIYGSFLYNLGYMGASKLNISNLESFIQIALAYGNSIVLAAIGIVKLKKRCKVEGLLWLFTGAIPFVWLIRSYGFLHYGQIVAPYFVIILSELWEMLSDLKRKREFVSIKNSLRTSKALLTIYLLFFVLLADFLFGIRWAKGVYNRYFVREVDQYKAVEARLIDNIPVNERDSVVGYNLNLGFYLQFDLKPCYRFFNLQDWLIQCNDSIRNSIQNDFTTLKAKWILIDDTGANTAIDNILERHYTVYAEEDRPFTRSVYRLYRLYE